MNVVPSITATTTETTSSRIPKFVPDLIVVEKAVLTTLKQQAADSKAFESKDESVADVLTRSSK